MKSAVEVAHEWLAKGGSSPDRILSLASLIACERSDTLREAATALSDLGTAFAALPNDYNYGVLNGIERATDCILALVPKPGSRR